MYSRRRRRRRRRKKRRRRSRRRGRRQRRGKRRRRRRPGDQQEWQRLEAVNQLVVEKALALGGTCTGEHGVGIGKRKFMALEHGASLHLMKQIKDLIDPKGLMNPGKIFI